MRIPKSLPSSQKSFWYTRSISKYPAAPAKRQAIRALPNSRLLFSKHKYVPKTFSFQPYFNYKNSYFFTAFNWFFQAIIKLEFAHYVNLNEAFVR